MRSLELFAGCGGLALGMARAGFKHDAIIEYDRDAVATLVGNKRRKIDHVKDWDINQVDARSLGYKAMKAVDVISGGPPCQPFSIGGKHLGPRDPRNMWPEAIRAIREMRPKAFVLENVRGLFRPAFQPYLEYITLQLSHPDLNPGVDEFWEDHLARLRQHARARGAKNAAYRVVSRAVNAADYGAGQKRHRAIFIGLLSTFGDEWEFPESTHSQEALAWAKHVDLTAPSKEASSLFAKSQDRTPGDIGRPVAAPIASAENAMTASAWPWPRRRPSRSTRSTRCARASRPGRLARQRSASYARVPDIDL